MDREPVGVRSNLGAALAISPESIGFRVDRREATGELILAIHGEADLATAPFLAEALGEASGNGHQHVVLDAAGLDFIDAHCLNVIVNARLFLREQGKALVVRSPATHVRRLLAICDIEDLLESRIAALHL
ncbi:MAG: STAS domain-containing protein [Acidimicrobiia bacterium]